MATAVTAPIEGKVLQVVKKPGETVEENDVIILLEAMKMEIPVVAPAAGTIKEVKVSPGDSVESEAILALIE
ncbi:MAG: acetyl-CoA carboxylase biotin carboxyl carrier protein subunit [Acidobacteria bacterium]|nr:acetyl-CoA carboxylase biotin carboxyl carrier protein subunit [Acidobacteriota bacterium]